MIAIRPMLVLFVLSLMALGCSKEEPKKMPAAATGDAKVAQDKAHEEAKAKMATPAAPAK